MGDVGYSAELAARVRDKLAGVKGVTEREMFGGLTFMVAGNVCCGVLGEDLMVRVGADLHQDALTRPDVREAGVSGRAVRGTVYVGRGGLAADAELGLWVDLGLAHARSRPPKAKARPRPKPKAKPKAARGR